MKALTVFLVGLFFSATGLAADTVTETDNVYAKAAANDARSSEDRQRDERSKPSAVLEFFGIQPGMRVLDLYSGGGYYTELLSYVVGESGEVVAHTNKAYADFLGDETTRRFTDGRLPNVVTLFAENNKLVLAEDGLDAAIMILAYHDIYLVDEENDWPKIDGRALLEEIYNGLRPGGILGIVDHVAAAGSPAETGGTLHRIDPAIVIQAMNAAGFILDGESDILRNPTDNHSVHMRDPSVVGQTDRFVMRFRKP